jgi:ubiquinone/menaquinone biosynthesis C-methylase UbiE
MWHPALSDGMGRSYLLSAVIRLSQRTRFGYAKVSFFTLKFADSGPKKQTESDHEAEQLDAFLDSFPGILDELAGKRILDYGCGFGGKAVELARRLPSATVIGVDVHQRKVDKGAEFAARMGVPCTFLLGSHEGIPLEDDSIDAIVCHDVLEHVHDPAATAREIQRVLRAGGKAYIIFPPYQGPLSHHLDFITRFPGLHWLWSAETIIDTVNAMLATDFGKRFNAAPQAQPLYSAYAGKKVLMQLNGTGTEHLMALYSPGFEVSIARVTLMDKLTKLMLPRPLVVAVKRAVLTLLPTLADYFTISAIATLRKR